MNPHDRRLQLLNAGYAPLPLFGKRPSFENWATRPPTNPDEIRLWATMWPGASNTGILCRLCPALDIDLLDSEAAEAVQQLVEDRFGEHGRVLPRIGKPPKRAIVFRTLRPFAKITAMLLAGNEAEGKRPDERVEFLCDGQQIVVDDVHPETKQAYRWYGGCVGDVKRDELPLIDEAEARGLIDDIVDLLVKEHGYRLVNAKGVPIDKGASAVKGNGHDAGGAEWAAPSDLIDHDVLCAHAMRLLKSGMQPGAAVQMLRAQVADLQGVDPERKQRRLDEIGDIVSSAQAKIGAGRAPQQSEDLGEWDAGDDPGEIKPRPWLLGNQFCRGFISSIVAAGGTGKTSLRLLQFISMALGRSLCGQYVFHRCRVLLVTLEDNDDELQRRIKAVLDHYRIDRSELKGWLFCKAVRRMKLAELAGRQRIVGPLEKLLRSAIERRKPDVISLDPFVKLHGRF
jgi:AAA domain/Bifunctional DNA primase/polymerase, N-terminal